MRRIMLYAVLVGIWVLTGTTQPVQAAQVVDLKDAPVCKVCGMNRDASGNGRMLIEFKDGTRAGTCSLRCTALELGLNQGRAVKTILVADYNTNVLIDARSAAWVIGGTKEGLMTSRPKWAFGDKSAAEAFVNENGGAVSTFDDALKAAYADLYEDVKTGSAGGPGEVDAHAHHQHDAANGGHNHGGHSMGPEAQMIFNPAFINQLYHVHPAGMWMVDTQFVHTDMNGLLHGTSEVATNSVSPQGRQPFGYMNTPTKMKMDMAMVMAMYGVTDRFTLMGMTGFMANQMDMLMNMGMGNKGQPPMNTNGFGDFEFTGIYGFTKYLVGSLGLNVPTGSINEHIGMMNKDYRAPYDMQLGSGTWNLKPSLTYWGFSDDKKWNWGAQSTYTFHMDRNSYHYSPGNDLLLTSWIQRAFGPFTGSFRLAYNNWGQIQGRDPGVDRLLAGASIPDADPHNYGGQRLDGLLGVAFQKDAFSVGIEGGVPFYQDLHGLQLKTDWLLGGRIRMMF